MVLPSYQVLRQDQVLATHSHTLDGFENTAFAATQTPFDAPLPIYDIQALKVMLEYGRCHIWALAKSSANLAYQLEMMLAVCGSETALAVKKECC